MKKLNNLLSKQDLSYIRENNNKSQISNKEVISKFILLHKNFQ